MTKINRGVKILILKGEIKRLFNRKRLFRKRMTRIKTDLHVKENP